MEQLSIEELLSEADDIQLAAVPTKEEQKTLQNMASSLIKVESHIKTLEQKVKELKEVKKNLSDREIPDYMEEIGQDICGLSESNASVHLQAFVYARIPEEKKEEAFHWLESQGHGDLIRVNLSLSFAKGDLEKALELQEFIVNEGYARPDVKMDVHWRTLESFCKSYCVDKDGKPIYDHNLPEDLLGLNVGRTVKIKRRK